MIQFICSTYLNKRCIFNCFLNEQNLPTQVKFLSAFVHSLTPLHLIKLDPRHVLYRGVCKQSCCQVLYLCTELFTVKQSLNMSGKIPLIYLYMNIEPVQSNRSSIFMIFSSAKQRVVLVLRLRFNIRRIALFCNLHMGQLYLCWHYPKLLCNIVGMGI